MVLPTLTPLVGPAVTSATETFPIPPAPAVAGPDRGAAEVRDHPFYTTARAGGRAQPEWAAPMRFQIRWTSQPIAH